MKAINCNQSYLQSVEDRIGQWNDRLNMVCEHVGLEYAIPSMKFFYNTAGSLACTSLGLVSTSLKERLAGTWHDPVSTTFILKITKIVEKAARWHALKKPVINGSFLRGHLHFLDRSIISTAQHLHNFIKEVNFLLALPSTLRHDKVESTFDHFVGRLPNFFGRSYVLVSNLILGGKYLLLNLINLVMKVAETLLYMINLDALALMINISREVFDTSSSKLSEKITEVTHEVINRRENSLRKELAVDVTNGASEYLVPLAIRATVKSALGAALFWAVKSTLQSNFAISDLPINLAGAAAAGTLVWKAALKPTLIPYYDSYLSKFDPTHSHLREFCRKYHISRWYTTLKTIQIYSRDS